MVSLGPSVSLNNTGFYDRASDWFDERDNFKYKSILINRKVIDSSCCTIIFIANLYSAK